jgi:hypothetical protein
VQKRARSKAPKLSSQIQSSKQEGNKPGEATPFTLKTKINYSLA